MNVLSILIICGFIYLLFVTWLFGKKSNGNQKSDTSANEAKPSEEKQDAKAQTTAPAPATGVPLVPKSNFNMEDFQKVLTESMKAAMIYVLNSKMGEVTPDQVEFKDKDDNDAPSDNTDNSKVDAEPDIDDVEPENASPPASGNTLEDIEAALSVAANASKSSADDKAKAGNVLSGMRDVVFIGKIMSANDKINEGVMACIAESLRRQQKPKKKGSPAPKKKSKPIDIGNTLRDPDMIKRKKDDDEED